jgi:hypothetical protein
MMDVIHGYEPALAFDPTAPFAGVPAQRAARRARAT